MGATAQVDGMTALHWAVYYDDFETAKLLVDAGADVNAKNRYGVNPLALACPKAAAAIPQTAQLIKQALSILPIR